VCASARLCPENGKRRSERNAVSLFGRLTRLD
jgi:hypothetical protein